MYKLTYWFERRNVSYCIDFLSSKYLIYFKLGLKCFYYLGDFYRNRIFIFEVIATRNVRRDAQATEKDTNVIRNGKKEGRCCTNEERQLSHHFQLIFVYASRTLRARQRTRRLVTVQVLSIRSRRVDGQGEGEVSRQAKIHGITSTNKGRWCIERGWCVAGGVTSPGDCVSVEADAAGALVISALAGARRAGVAERASLASTDSGDEGAGHRLPRKRPRMLSPPARPADMHQPTSNGAPTHHVNGDAAPRNGDLQPPGLRMTQTDQEIVRLIGQHLISIGLERSAALLMEESGLHLEHPAAATFRQHVLAGDWVKADHDLRALHDLLRDSPHVDPHNLAEMKFVVLEQKYLEHLEAGRVLDALHVLRNELTPLQYDTARVHRLSALMMCADAAELQARAHWPGGGPRSRAEVLARVQAVLPPALMMAPGRLRALLAQAAAQQAARCRFHAAPRPAPPPAADHIPFTLLADHHCSADNFPIHSLQVLNEHCDEVWYCKWSPDGSKLASGSKDNTVMIWDFDPVAKRLSFRKSLDGHTYGVSFLSWSPDGRYLIAAGPEDCPDLWIWNMETEQLHLKMSHSQEDSLTAVAWHATGDKFVCGGARGQFYHCGLDGTLLNSWDGVRVNALCCRADARGVLAADTHHRVRHYDFTDLTDRNLIQEEHAVMAMTLNAADTLLLLNVANQGVHLWDIRARALVRRFRGLSQGHFTIHACFGGAHQDFIASGSEDNKVYIWHVGGEEPVAVMSGHTRCVNCVAWNPAHHDVLVSASDDYSLRLWGPRPPRA